MISGGLGSCGAPNDGGIHQNFHFIRQGYQRTALGWHRNALLAKSKEDFEVTKSGDIKLSISLPVSLESDVYALQCIRDYENSKLVMWAWASRGYATMSDYAKWHFDGDISKAEACMGAVEKGEFTKYVKLEELPALHILGEDSSHEPLAKPDSGFLNGERVHVWFVDKGSDGMIPLPTWSSLPIECTIAVWRQEEKAWKDKIQKRHPKPLTAHQQKQYDQWVENCTRRIVLDQQSKSVIKHPASCSKSHLSKFGVLLDPCAEFWIIHAQAHIHVNLLCV